jgi:hypothetical protein
LVDIFLILETQQTDNQIEIYRRESQAFGKTYGQWTVEWWRWALSTPKSVNPVVDKSGNFAGVNQPSENVWFLAGKFGTLEVEFPERHCNVPFGRSVLFPVINCLASPLEYPELKTEQQLINHVSNDENGIVRKDCFLNDNTIAVTRVRSDPLIFSLTINNDNAIGVKGGSTIASADGYWVFLKPLPIGEYALRFIGACENGRLNSGANYTLKII